MFAESLQAIVSFNEEGKMLPLYFKINGVQLKVLTAKETGGVAGQIEFACTVEDQGYAKPLNVAYITGECKWKRIV